MIWPGKEYRSSAILSRPFTPQEVVSIIRYGLLARNLQLSTEELAKYHDILKAIAEVSGQVTLFPNLLTLTVDIDATSSDEIAECLLDLIPLSLHGINMSVITSRASSQVQRILFALKGRQPLSIQSFAFRSEAAFVEGRRMVELLNGWNSLRRVTIYGCLRPEVALAALALPNLHSLDLGTNEPRGESLKIGSVSTARTLRKLSIYYLDDYSSATNFITLLPNASLATITVTAYGSIAHLKEFFLALSRRRPVTVLRELDLRLSCSRDPEIAPALSFHDHVSSLLVFPNLVHLFINIDASLSLSDEDVRRMSLAWPRIRWLTLYGATPESRQLPECTLPALLWLARHCAELAWLDISLDARVTAIPSGIPSRATQRSLRTLILHRSPIASSADVIRFLACHFPGLRIIDGVDQVGEQPRWRDAQEEFRRIAKEV
ncbi:uncharacterized protein SCHCODRAFT_02753567 [Schizophyllum commune H4-8]|uniref:uncharacterized protein n=1 Tax=Schizophyllum commune (strain H4-8 / FGSC 9210) TaxID=578458 RepID=UPI00215F02D9|nr:uncharacterized protein SCHCODRAFT_02753567 [Schizophyllum commune H4-8]KAI5885261.1 hypothetical protein SCHCODRAFT_02753567 [Schizophyllum commune H4-8]